MRNKHDRETYYLVIARDTGANGKPRCVNCGALADDVHEILPRSFFGPRKQKDLFDIKNRVCLCRKCHSELHNDSGRKKLLKALHEKYNYQYEGRARCLLEEMEER